MITLKTLKWSNCFSYAADNTLQLDANTITQLVGVNGAGKSSIPLILEEVLWNKNSEGRKKADIPNRRLGQPYSISLDFDVDENTYNLSLTRKATLKVKLTENGKDISSHTATNTFKTVEQILGVDFKTFSQLVYQNTTNSLQFLTATDTNRKKFLINLLNLEVYIQYFEEFKQLAKEFSSKVTALESKVSTIEKWLEENNLEGMKILTPQKIDINLEEDEKLLGSLQLEFENISETNKKISKNENYRRRLDAIDLKDPGKTKEPTDDIVSKISSLETEVAAYDRDIKKVKSLGHACHSCGQPITPEFKSNFIEGCEKSITLRQPMIAELQEKLKQVKADNAEVAAYQKAQKEFESLYSAIDASLPKDFLDAQDLKERIAKVQLQLAEKRSNLQELIKENNRIERNNTKIEIIKEQTEDFQTKLQAVQDELEEVSKTYNNLELLKKAFSTNGLLAYKIEFLVKELEVLVNEYLAELSDGRFTLEFAINNDKLNVVLTDEGHEVDIISLSSGELARVTTATLLAIRKLMSSISKSKINVLFLDEVIAVLDEQGREKLVDILAKENELNTFIVSHEWSHPLLVKLDIVKENNVSRIEDG